MPRNLSEADRKKNQFDKEERLHLLGIMKQYAPLLDNSASTLARKKIWTTIEDEFKKAGFTRKTSAQLKKYWQNYKYHCKKARALGKENKKRIDLEMNENPEWNRYQIFVNNRSTSKYSDVPGVFQSLHDPSRASPMESDRRSEAYEDNEGSSRKLDASEGFMDLSQIKTEKIEDESTSIDYDGRERNPSECENPEDSLDEKKEIFTNEDRLASTSAVDRKTRNRIVVSNAKISNNSVTVSIVYPEDSEQTRRGAVSKTSEASSSSVTLSAEKSVEGEKRSRDDASDFCDSEEHNNQENFSGNFDANIEDCDSFECSVNDLVCEKQDRDFSKRRRAFTFTEKQENDAVVRTRGSETRGDPFGPRSYVFLTDYRNQLKHKLLLQQLETEEKRLKVKIAEMAIQEVQLRIKALNEDMRRTEELHRLHLARAASETGHF
ncbi:uncharacterized protein LOC143188371 [Calliopsis andreniformis]|uniref:uncharacterized protein LOC143188371 n=1 Tax=Calliopsis andreniformis TaxID=337506 RepID=UPI003FCD4DA3